MSRKIAEALQPLAASIQKNVPTHFPDFATTYPSDSEAHSFLFEIAKLYQSNTVPLPENFVLTNEVPMLSGIDPSEDYGVDNEDQVVIDAASIGNIAAAVLGIAIENRIGRLGG